MRVEPYAAGLSQYYYLYTKRVNQKSYQSIDEVARTGKANATNSILAVEDPEIPDITDENTLVQVLSNPALKFKILSHIGKYNLMKLIEKFLPKEKMILGLNFFSQQKILNLLEKLPPEKLLKILIRLFTAEGLIKLLPSKELIKMLWSDKIKEQDLVKMLDSLPTHLLIQILESIQGKALSKRDHGSVITEIAKLKKGELLEGISAIPRSYLENIAKFFLQNEPTIITEISKDALFRAVGYAEKPRLIQSMLALDTEDIAKFVGELPQELMAKVATMIQPEQLAPALLAQFGNILQALF